MLRLIERPGDGALLRVPPSTRAVVSWNTTAPAGEIALTAHRCDGGVSGPLPFARWSPAERRSLGGADAVTRIDVDVVRSNVPFCAIGVASSVELDTVAVTVPPRADARVAAISATEELDVPRVSQYSPAYPAQRGWCSAAVLTMLLRYHGVAADLPEVVGGVVDTAYGNTGNWAFNAAYAGARGLRGVVAYLSGLDHVAAFVAAGLPVAVSIRWERGDLPGAPLARSDGHLLVVRGVGRAHVAVNDPAQPEIATRYPRAAFDALFRAHGGAAYLIAPHARTAELIALANAPASGAAERGSAEQRAAR